MKPPYAIGSVPRLSGHAIAYRWRSPPRVRRHRASKPQGSSERVLPCQVTMDQLICASLSHTHYWYEVGMLKVPVLYCTVYLVLFTVFLAVYRISYRTYSSSNSSCCFDDHDSETEVAWNMLVIDISIKTWYQTNRSINSKNSQKIVCATKQGLSNAQTARVAQSLPVIRMDGARPRAQFPNP